MRAKSVTLAHNCFGESNLLEMTLPDADQAVTKFAFWNMVFCRLGILLKMDTFMALSGFVVQKTAVLPLRGFS
jgi:hypothetical protein